MIAEQTFQQLNLPRIVQEQRASALRFADPMVQAIWNALLVSIGCQLASAIATYETILPPCSANPWRTSPRAG